VSVLAQPTKKERISNVKVFASWCKMACICDLVYIMDSPIWYRINRNSSNKLSKKKENLHVVDSS